jgi:hypothetical protein
MDRIQCNESPPLHAVAVKFESIRGHAESFAGEAPCSFYVLLQPPSQSKFSFDDQSSLQERNAPMRRPIIAATKAQLVRYKTLDHDNKRPDPFSILLQCAHSYRAIPLCRRLRPAFNIAVALSLQRLKGWTFDPLYAKAHPFVVGRLDWIRFQVQWRRWQHAERSQYNAVARIPQDTSKVFGAGTEGKPREPPQQPFFSAHTSSYWSRRMVYCVLQIRHQIFVRVLQKAH